MFSFISFSNSRATFHYQKPYHVHLFAIIADFLLESISACIGVMELDIPVSWLKQWLTGRQDGGITVIMWSDIAAVFVSVGEKQKAGLCWGFSVGEWDVEIDSLAPSVFVCVCEWDKIRQGGEAREEGCVWVCYVAGKNGLTVESQSSPVCTRVSCLHTHFTQANTQTHTVANFYWISIRQQSVRQLNKMDFLADRSGLTPLFIRTVHCYFHRCIFCYFFYNMHTEGEISIGQVTIFHSRPISEGTFNVGFFPRSCSVIQVILVPGRMTWED